MKFISTKQAAELWGISPRRVALLASQGRIDGAAFMGNTWLIPENALKPADSRKKSSKALSDSSGNDFFPYIICVVNSEEQVSRFTPDQQELYRSCLLYEAGDFAASAQIAEKLLSSKERNVRLGALYLLPFSMLYQHKYAAAEKYSILFQTEYHNFDKHDMSFEMLYAEFEAEMGRVSYSSFKNIDFSQLSEKNSDLLPVIACYKIFSVLTDTTSREIPHDISSYELIGALIDRCGCFYSSMLMHVSLALICGACGSFEDEYLHMKRAVDISLEHDTVFNLAYMMFFDRDMMETVLSEYSPQVKERFCRLANVFVEARSGFAEYLRKKPTFSKLKDEDYRLISLCLKSCSIDSMAEQFGLSRSGMNRRLTNLYSKLGVKSKKEMENVYLSSVLNWGRE